MACCYAMKIIAILVVILSHKILMWCRWAMDRFSSFLIYDTSIQWKSLNTWLYMYVLQHLEFNWIAIESLNGIFYSALHLFQHNHNGAGDNDRFHHLWRTFNVCFFFPFLSLYFDTNHIVHFRFSNDLFFSFFFLRIV